MTRALLIRAALCALAALAPTVTAAAALVSTAVLAPPVTVPPVTPVTVSPTLLEALGLGGIIGVGVGLLVGITISWWRRPPRLCSKCNYVRLPLVLPPGPGEPAPDDIHDTVDTVTPVKEFMCRYACSCVTAGVASTHVAWLSFPPPPVTRCPRHVTIEVCWRGSAVELPKITIVLP